MENFSAGADHYLVKSFLSKNNWQELKLLKSGLPV